MKTDKNNNMMKSRLGVLFIIFILIFVYLMVHLGVITFVESDNYNQRVLYQYISKQTMSDNIIPKRGQISDRNGIVLAENVRVYNIIFDPNGMIAQPENVRIASMKKIAAEVDGVTLSQLEEYLVDIPSVKYKIIGKAYELEDLTELKRAIDADEIKGVYLEGYYKREYPYNTLASDVIGIYDQTGTATYGVEQEYNDYLTGIYGRLYGYVDNGVFVKQEEILAENGYNVNLTLDFTIQKYVEDALLSYMESHEAKSANALVMNPQTGEILAMASYPTFDLNDPYNLELSLTEDELAAMTSEEIQDYRYELWKNFAVSDTFEPGSTYKALVLAAALEEGVVDLDTEFYCGGFLEVADRTIKCWKTTGHGTLTAAEALVNSCNVSFMQIGALLGRDLFYNYSQLFGVGEKTEVDMVAEGGYGTSLYFQKDQLNEVELATSSFGQGFNMTSIQLVTAFSSLINGGYMYQPHIMASIQDDSGHIVENFEPLVTRQVISQETSDTMRQLLQQVVEEGTGKGAYIEGYHIGGKTGTAEKGNRENENYVVSFIGYAEQEEAQVVVLVAIDEPEGVDPTSAIAVEVFVDIMEDVLPYMNIFKDIDEEPIIENADETGEGESLDANN